MPWLLLVAFACGLILPLQPGINAHLRTHLGSPFAAALVSFTVGTATLVVVTLATGRLDMQLGRAFGEAPWWAWTGGFIGAIFVTASIFLAPRLGASLLVGAVVTGQLFGSTVIDHFGFVGFPVQPVNWGRLVGTALLVAGVVVVQQSSR